MALNQRYTHGKHIKLTAPRDIESGDPVKVGAIAGVTQTSAKKGETVTVWLDGSYDLPLSGNAAEGDVVSINSSGNLSKSNTDPFGVVVKAKTTGDTAEIMPFGKIVPGSSE